MTITAHDDFKNAFEGKKYRLNNPSSKKNGDIFRIESIYANGSLLTLNMTKDKQDKHETLSATELSYLERIDE